jgi:hypothetical protein
MCQLAAETISLIWNFFDGCLPWLRGLLCHGLIKRLHVWIGHCHLFFLCFRCGVRGIGIFSGLEGLHDPDRVVFGELDPSCNLRVQLPPDLT